jgi:hypothetical protein
LLFGGSTIMRNLILLLFVVGTSGCGASIPSLRSQSECRVWREGMFDERASTVVRVAGDAVRYDSEAVGAYYRGPSDIFVNQIIGPYRVGRYDGTGGVTMHSLFGDHRVATVGGGSVRRPTLFGERPFAYYNNACSDRDAALATIALLSAEETSTSHLHNKRY